MLHELFIIIYVSGYMNVNTIMHDIFVNFSLCLYPFFNEVCGLSLCTKVAKNLSAMCTQLHD